MVRSAAPGEAARTAYVGEVLGNFDKLLHIHHEGEDLLMYPRLAERAPACAMHVGQMLAQHRRVTQRLETIEPLSLRWMETANPAAGEELAGLYAELSDVLNVHLRREVTKVMPAADRVMTQKELQAARSSEPARRLCQANRNGYYYDAGITLCPTVRLSLIPGSNLSERSITEGPTASQRRPVDTWSGGT